MGGRGRVAVSDGDVRMIDRRDGCESGRGGARANGLRIGDRGVFGVCRRIGRWGDGGGRVGGG